MRKLLFVAVALLVVGCSKDDNKPAKRVEDVSKTVAEIPTPAPAPAPVEEAAPAPAPAPEVEAPQATGPRACTQDDLLLILGLTETLNVHVTKMETLTNSALAAAQNGNLTQTKNLLLQALTEANAAVGACSAFQASIDMKNCTISSVVSSNNQVVGTCGKLDEVKVQLEDTIRQLGGR